MNQINLIFGLFIVMMFIAILIIAMGYQAIQLRERQTIILNNQNTTNLFLEKIYNKMHG